MASAPKFVTVYAGFVSVYAHNMWGPFLIKFSMAHDCQNPLRVSPKHHPVYLLCLLFQVILGLCFKYLCQTIKTVFRLKFLSRAAHVNSTVVNCILVLIVRARKFLQGSGFLPLNHILTH